MSLLVRMFGDFQQWGSGLQFGHKDVNELGEAFGNVDHTLW